MRKKIKKAIIIAAGMGTRLKMPHHDAPKTLLRIGDETLFERAIRTLRNAGIHSIACVVGHRKECFQFEGIQYFYNDRYQLNNMLHSLFYANPFMDEGFLAFYADILFEPAAIDQLLEHPSSFAVVVDRDWQKNYENRTLDPKNDAELVLDQNSNLLKIGKRIVAPEQATGEFIGMFKVEDSFLSQFKEGYAGLCKTFRGAYSKPFQTSASFERASLTDYFQYLIDQGCAPQVVGLNTDWFEIDTAEDYKNALKKYG